MTTPNNSTQTMGLENSPNQIVTNVDNTNVDQFAVPYRHSNGDATNRIKYGKTTF